jgi:CubicO group peptidase (beta-lactamase class C family)
MEFTPGEKFNYVQTNYVLLGKIIDVVTGLPFGEFTARKVAPDHTVRWDGVRWGVPREEICAGLRGAEVEIERRLDGSHWPRFRKRYLRLRHCPDPPHRFATPSGLRPPGLANQKGQPPKEFKPKWHVPQTHTYVRSHPWRRPWKRTFLPCEKEDISTLR